MRRRRRGRVRTVGAVGYVGDEEARGGYCLGASCSAIGVGFCLGASFIIDTTCSLCGSLQRHWWGSHRCWWGSHS